VIRGPRFRSRSRVKRLAGAFLCWLGIHRDAIVGRYYSGDGPEVEVVTCARCGREI
jgi:hypothetical protein